MAKRRMTAFALFTWAPLAVCTLVEGDFLGGVSVPFVYDLDAYARFLVYLPLLIGAELLVHRRVREVVEQFRERGLIADEDQASFDAIIERTMRLRNSVLVEVVLLVVAFTGGYWLWRTHGSLHVSTWYADVVDNNMRLTWAGCWYAFVSLPIARFIVLRWYFRLAIWYVFLFRVSRLRLRLNPLHPDRAGGLAFVSDSLYAFAPVLIAQSIFLSALIGNQIWHQDAHLPEFKFMITGVLVFLMLVVLLPLTFFSFQMMRARREALREYGLLASRYASDFRQKWLRRSETPGGELLGSADIQTLAALARSFDVVREMGMLPFGRNVVIRLALMLALPLSPLVLTMIPIEELLARLLKVFV
jgi:hypothetical protein